MVSLPRPLLGPQGVAAPEQACTLKVGFAKVFLYVSASPLRRVFRLLVPCPLVQAALVAADVATTSAPL